jgi:MFS family permease
MRSSKKNCQALGVDQFKQALANRAFRWLEGTAVFSNTSVWILSLVSGFVMETLTKVPILITMASAITSITGLFSASISGAAADARDQRLVILLAKIILFTSSAFLTLVAFAGALTPGTLLVGLGGVGLAMGTSSPSWWNTVGNLVPARLVPVALSLDSFQWNIGQVVGPILGGYVLHAEHATVLFLVCTVLLLPLLGFLAVWRGRSELRLSTPGGAAAEKTLGAISTGWRFFAYTPELRAIAARTILYVTPAVALGALLPLLATRYLHATALTYGFYLAISGLGALAASLVLPRLHGMLHLDVLIAFATVANALAVALVTIFPHPVVAIPALIVTGATWAWVTTALTIATRDCAPQWVRTRLLAIYYLVQQAPYAAGGILFGIVATFLPLRITLLVDAALFLPGVLLIPRFGLPVVEQGSQNLVARPEIVGAEDIDPDDGPVLVLIEYQVPEEDVEHFLAAMSRLRIVRRRLGASRWGIYEDIANHGRFVETFTVPSWDRYLRQRAHYTEADARIEQQARQYHKGGEPPRVTRFVHPDTAEAAKARASWRKEMAKLVADPFIEPPHAPSLLNPISHLHHQGPNQQANQRPPSQDESQQS